MVTLNVSTVITRRKPNSRVAVHGRAVGEREMLVALLRDFARRTAQEHRENLQPAHSQLRVINSIARETLVTTREFIRTHTVRRRLNLVPCTVTIPKVEPDSRLSEKLRAEFPGILNWAVQGCLDWQRQGLSAPSAIRDAAEDSIGRWLEERKDL